ncbi:MULTISPECIES: NADPH-dependent FMN reductase [unclassified Tolypothrix]|uniref:NADPH-dependent FMN reductase n=1 Tax=unclassified Tolypothrix TaxID=2649714 RepID=UPI0005EAB6F3|nr:MULTISPECIES: NADPH-dependent FMN reductase [unclassified Tolypothrix]BAY88711.1 NADPH-dependent FMN reductase [Microchaete diplosiphon NIES-3275]EKF01582.1 FMN reductase [Tolypothrix sp. PCC 7601]MBE9085090.1 NADPH-dependent FMN reductase [Tolypothrix sp. LEGE 11397]UYD29376.1 NADPH-dependent FMN reductase [Tolypothrix sp. PCC 7712]UYD34718.1 NADPH-dependent FMN reductase [Tolypothrix sp. PCC 7601]
MAHILAIAGSPSHPSRTYSLLEYASKLLVQQGVTVDIISVRDIPAEDLAYGRYDSPALEKPKALLEKADGVIIATPIYKAAYTGVLKAFLDLLPQKSLAGKVVLPLATGGTIAHLLAIEYALKPVLSELGARHILSTIYSIDKQIQVQADGSIQLDAEIAQRLQDVLSDFAKAIDISAATKEVAHAN